MSETPVCTTVMQIHSLGSHPRPSWSSGRTSPHKEPGGAPPELLHPPDWRPAHQGTPSASGSHSQTAGTDSAEDSIPTLKSNDTQDGNVLSSVVMSTDSIQRWQNKRSWRRQKLKLLLAGYVRWWGQHSSYLPQRLCVIAPLTLLIGSDREPLKGLLCSSGSHKPAIVQPRAPLWPLCCRIEGQTSYPPSMWGARGAVYVTPGDRISKTLSFRWAELDYCVKKKKDDKVEGVLLTLPAGSLHHISAAPLNPSCGLSPAHIAKSQSR